MYLVNEVFSSIQGEGPWIGYSAVFVRFAGCNMRCSFCDTDHDHGDEMTLGQLVSAANRAALDIGVDRVVLTGGEPLLQVDRKLLNRLPNKTHIETNGMVPTEQMGTGVLDALQRCEAVVVSPKGKALNLDLVAHATCVKALCPAPGGISHSDLLSLAGILGTSRIPPDRRSCILQPVTPRGGITGAQRWNEFGVTCRQTVAAARRLNNDSPIEWRVIPQTHVFMGVR